MTIVLAIIAVAAFGMFCYKEIKNAPTIDDEDYGK